MNVIIVGHGPSILAEPMGEEIDKFDTVIRLKRCQDTLNHPEFFGTKTDVVCGSWTIAPHLKKIPSDKYWVFLDSRHEHIHEEQIVSMEEWFSPHECIVDKDLCDRWNETYRDMRTKFDLHPQVEAKKTSDELGHTHMSAGMHAIIYACKYLKPDKLVLVGFDNLTTGEFTWSITRGPEWDHYPDHNWATEHAMLPVVSDYFNVDIGVLLPDERTGSSQEGECTIQSDAL